MLETYESLHEEAVKVTRSGGQQITSSVGHRYYTQRGWIGAEDLRAGDILQLVNGETVVVEQVQHELLENPQPLYNFAVEDNHNYYVAESVEADVYDFVLTHNKNCGRTGKQKRLAELSNDLKLPKNLRAELINSKKVYGRYHVPEGYELRHRVGYEAYKGYGYSYSDLQLKSLHSVETRIQRMLGLFNR